MKSLRSLPLCVLAGVFLCSIASQAQQASPAVRIVSPIDESQRVTLTHTVNPLANAANDRGAAPDGMELNRLQLVLQRSPAQEAALHALIAQQTTPGSASYHQWLTPAQFGTQFGTSDQDIATVESWLGSHGFSVSKVNAGKGTLEFSGSVAQLREAFHTQIHKYVVNGETHFANANDPQIPAALAPVIAGFTSLNNFHPRSYLNKLGETSFNPTTHQVSNWTWGNSAGQYYVLAPGDFSVQYDLNPLYATGINGNGQTIAIINESNINIDLVNQFRALFNLPANPPQIIIDGNDPGVDGINNPDGPNYASTEAYLDVEWAGAVAPQATVDLVIAADTSLESGLILAMERAVYSDVAPVLSISFGSCESSLGSYNGFINSLWEQAAAQGQTVMVSAGDDGSAGCDDDNSVEYASGGQAVNGFASTPYNVAVGGTDFYYTDYATGGASISNYWSTSISQLPAISIKSYIPEQPWNDSQYGLNIYNEYTASGDTSTTIAGGSGGASNAAVCSTTYNASSGACNGTLSGYPKPSWQTGTGVPADSVRDLPDVSLFSANGSNDSFYPICATDGDCQTANLTSGLVQIYGVGGTSASSPAFAGIMALINQRYGRQGQADNILYALKSQYPAAFHDVTNGSNSMPCEILPAVTPDCIAVTSPDIVSGVTEGQIGNTTTKTPEYNAAAGYNLATGLGTIDVNNLLNDWANVKLAASATTLTATPTAITHGAAVSISGAVTGTGTPTGNVTLMTDSTEQNQQGQGLATSLNGLTGTFGNGAFALNSGGQYSGSVTTLPGGSYNVWASYSGDSNNAMSTSTKIPVTVNPEASGIFFSAFTSLNGTATAGKAVSGTVDYGSQVDLSAQIAPSSQLSAFETCTTSCPVFTIPTGTVTFADNSTTINTALVNAEGDAEFNAPFGVGPHSVIASYTGDKSYNPSTASAITFTVGKDTPVIELGASALTSSTQLIDGPDQPAVLTVLVLNNAQYSAADPASGTFYTVPVAAPTGTVTASGFPSGVPTTATLSAAVDPESLGGTQAVEGVANFIIPAGTTSGTYNVTFSYSGDGNYFGVPGSSNTEYSIPIVNTNSFGLQNTVTTAAMTGSISPNSSITITGTVTGTSGHPAPTGGILVYAAPGSIDAYLGEVGFSSTSGTVSTFAFSLSSQVLPQGANQITLQYTGDSVYNPSAYTLNGGTPIPNPLSDFTLVPITTIVPVTAGSNGTTTINLGSVNGFVGTVNLTCVASTGISCGISPTATLTSGGSATATLTVTAPSGATSGNYNVLVQGVDTSGEYIHTLSMTADVSGSATGTPGFTIANGGNVTIAAGATTGNTSAITVTPTNGFTGIVDLGCAVTTAPAGATNPITCSMPASFDITGTGPVSEVLTINSSAATTAGNYVVTVTGTSGSISEPTTVNVAVSVPSFTLSNNGPISFQAGATTGNTQTITVTPTNGFTGTVGLTCAVTTEPTGATSVPTCALSANSVTASGTPTLTVTTTATTTTGAYVVTVTGTSGSIVETTQVDVQVNSAAMGFTLGNSGPITVSPGATTNNTSTINVASTTGGFSSMVSLNCKVTTSLSSPSDLPTCDFSSASITPGQTSTLTVTTTAATADLVYPKFGNGKGWLGAGSGALFAVLLFFFGIPARRRSWRSMLSILVAMVALGVMSSCGGGSSSSGGGGTTPTNPGTTAGTYTVTVTGSATGISPSPTTTVTLTVN